MLKSATIETVILEIARKEGYGMNGQDKLVTRTQIAQFVSARKRYRERMAVGAFEWKRPEAPKR